MSSELTMTVSPVITDKSGKRIAYILFNDKKRNAEGIIPACLITKSNGFTESEVRQLEDYMRKELTNLKKTAAMNNPFKALMK